ncbi:hypothetical protein TSUD_365660 [Trifolium subterraneum]|uniref:Uncharacterized protein n=1 Tax=Trifolium subterraneum TaxID=3900 RepID=A0A2Z6MPI1_TRISU|nr:hypothetical protein TSUD_365660 [Trifolium subterraneum]
MSALLEQSTPTRNNDATPYANPENNQEEKDLQERSTKKKKEGEQVFSMHSSLPKDYREVVDMQAAVDNGKSYRDRVLGGKPRKDGAVSDEEEEEVEDDGEGMKVEECVIGDYECPEFIFSKLKEKRHQILAGNNVEGPWKVVQKTRRNKKFNAGRNNSTDAINASPTKLNDAADITGSRFTSLWEDTEGLEKEGNEKGEYVKEVEMEGAFIRGESQGMQAGGSQKSKNKRYNGGLNNKKGEVTSENIFKESNLATRGGNFKGKQKAHGKRGVDKIVEKVGVETIENLLGHSQQPIDIPFAPNSVGDNGTSKPLDAD